MTIPRATALFLAGLLASCQGAPPQTTAPAARPSGGPVDKVGAGEGAVSIVAWAGYVERGEKNKLTVEPL
jgi:putative spermidine/putrescine transport system substrate-binding protein